ncbi:hypothetical protein DFH11DRAFT_1742507 [Phellopilus nigrolimitatus]|nr:hypothetical protein DFH11DRAFT_1742507 [Phellopilus nigrolimitatus]
MSYAPLDSSFASPKTMRATSISERRPLAPVTPQRTNRGPKMRAASSPLTPSNSSTISSPFTPITNVYSSSSSLVSPDSSVSTKVEFSPESAKSKTRSPADATNNWRSRAKENGIKVDAADYSYADAMNSSDGVPVPFLTTHRRPRQSLFQTNSSDSTAFISPKTARMPVVDGAVTAPLLSTSSLSSSLLSTPEPVRTLSGSFTLATPSPRTSYAIVQKLRQRGSLTDPARPRRRHISGPITGEALFDIDENAPTESPFPQSFDSPRSATVNDESFSTKRCVSAPFIAGRFYEGMENDDDDDDELEDDGLPSAPRSSRLRPTKSVSSLPRPASPKDTSTNEKACSVCSASSSPLSTLIPCEHLICSSCLTGALNIIGEKDMRCATCDKPVNDFKLLTPLKLGIGNIDEANKDDVKESNEDQSMKLLPSAFEELSVGLDDVGKNKVRFERVANETASPSVSSSCDDENVVVLRIDNVPWDVTPPSLVEFFSPYVAVRAHILLDPKGKTLSHAYVEVPAGDARNALRSVQNKSLGKGRRLRGVTVTMSSQGELMRALFPSWLGGFEGTHPTLDGLDQPAVLRTLENGLITLPEIDGLVALMKNPKSHFLKVPTLPFYTLVSILSKFPSDSDSRVFWSARLRDVLYGLLRLSQKELTDAACDLLVERIQSDFHDQRVLNIVVSTAVNCRVFTDGQRLGLFEKMMDAVAAKGGQLTCTAPKSQLSLSISTTLSCQSDEAITPDDSVSSLSGACGPGGRSQRNLGYGKPSTMRRNDNAFVSGNAPIYTTSPQMNFAGLALPQINAPPGLNFGNFNMGFGMPYAMNSPPQSPYDVLAREFNVEPDLVAALAQRLVYTGQGALPQAMGGFAYANGRM